MTHPLEALRKTLAAKAAEERAARPELSPQERAQINEAKYQHRQFFGRGEYKFHVYAGQGWDKKWGTPPLLGFVFADDEFLAERLAVERGIVNPFNCTFKPKFKNVGKASEFPSRFV